LEKNIIQSITNLPEADESAIIVEPESELEPKYPVVFTRVDGSDSSEVSEDDIEAEVVESNAIFDNDCLVNDQNDYAKNICIPRSFKSEVMAGEKVKGNVIISADSSPTEE
jgi:hypothetical protein